MTGNGEGDDHHDPSDAAPTLTPDQRLPHHPTVDRRRFLLTTLAGALAAPVAAETFSGSCQAIAL